MELLQKMVVTKVNKTMVVNSAAGRQVTVTNRPVFGLSLCESGQITYTMGTEHFVSRPGVAVLLPKGGNYTLHGDKNGLFPVINFQCKELECDRITLIPAAEQETCLRIFREMNQLSPQENRLELLGAFYKLLSVLSVDNEPKPMLSLIKYLENNLADPTLSNTRLAQEMGISEVYLRKLFQRYYKTTPKQYILDMRLGKARQLLVETALSVTQIARECGFSTPYHFCRCFKDKVGLPPTEYARENRAYMI